LLRVILYRNYNFLPLFERNREESNFDNNIKKMKNDIIIMIDLQKYWDNILGTRNEIDRCNKSILFWEKSIDDKKNDVLSLQQEIKDAKKKIDQRELGLAEKDGRAKDLEKRRFILKTERELGALTHELERVNLEKSNLEDELIELFDVLEVKESELSRIKLEFDDEKKQAADDVFMLKNRIKDYDELITEKQDKFDGLVNELQGGTRLRFLKLIKSDSGKGIVEVVGETCEGCHCIIPMHLVHELVDRENITICTNCGRFIWKKSS